LRSVRPFSCGLLTSSHWGRSWPTRDRRPDYLRIPPCSQHLLSPRTPPADRPWLVPRWMALVAGQGCAARSPLAKGNAPPLRDARLEGYRTLTRAMGSTLPPETDVDYRWTPPAIPTGAEITAIKANEEAQDEGPRAGGGVDEPGAVSRLEEMATALVPSHTLSPRSRFSRSQLASGTPSPLPVGYARLFLRSAPLGAIARRRPTVWMLPVEGV